MVDQNVQSRTPILWFARLAVGTVFVLNVSCALVFIFDPAVYAPGFELTGMVGDIMVRSMGILFLMWNVTYPPVILRPHTHRTLFAVILIQQAIGLACETWLWLSLPAGHPALHATGLRFIVFDALGFALMGAAFGLLHRASSPITP